MHVNEGNTPLKNYISEGLIERIRGSQDIVDIVSRHVVLKKKGQNYVGLCPFHSEKTPSFVVSPVKQIFHCFGCGTGGNVITFLMKHENISFTEAVWRLAKDAGIEMKGLNQADKGVNLIYEVNRLTADYYHDFLMQRREAEEARKYLYRRGLSREVMEEFQIGYAPAEWNRLHRFLKDKGYREEILLRSGVIIKGNGYYDRFRGRVIFPIFDNQNRVVGFGGRVLDDSVPKYLNSPETPLFKKGDILYGLNIARKKIMEAGYAIIVEGYMDVIAAHQAGLTNVIGTLGTAFTPNHLKKLSRLCREVILTFDSDNAGINAAMRCVDIFVGKEPRAKVLLLPTGEDPDTFIRGKGPDFFMELVEKSKNLVEFYIEHVITEKNGLMGDVPINRKLVWVNKCLDVIKRIPNRIEQEYYLKKVSSMLNIGLDALYVELKKTCKKVSIEKEDTLKLESPDIEETIIILLIKDKRLREKGRGILLEMDFVTPGHKRIVDILLDNLEIDIHTLIDSVEDNEVRSIMTRLALKDMYYDSPEKVLSDCIRMMQLRSFDRELREIEKEIVSAEHGGDFDRVKELLMQKQVVLEKKKGLYKINN